MSLFITLTAITFIDAYKSRIISLILKFLQHDPKITSLASELKEMEKELSTIPIVNEFAKHVKLQRKINKLRDERNTLVKNKAYKIMKIKYVVATATYLIVLGSLVTLIWLHRSESVVKLPPEWLWPFSSLFDWSYYMPGSITVPCWIAISSSATKTLARHF
ncbi:hypothetical protein RUM44_013206 [Polyplax serrata]|uniref:Guided entry of tail-anchored proteins factor 1 n=1 Tax=Polyplax serrata TaxID=468196 RepID=A0ABR1BFF3_POLSC